ncbi:hypothetical protein FORC81_p438 (plasmid) [Escherichia coli]|nr:hypothetical protein FORC81_p438 [Escherichia coli]
MVRQRRICLGGGFPRNTFNPLHHKKVGFDTTVVLDTKNGIHPACEPLLAVLFFLQRNHATRRQSDALHY